MTDAPHPSTSDEPRSTSRVLRACLTVWIAYALLVSAGLLVRVEIHRWGHVLEDWQFDPLRLALTCHLGAVVVFASLFLLLRERSDLPAKWGRAALAFMPFLLLISTDLIT